MSLAIERTRRRAPSAAIPLLVLTVVGLLASGCGKKGDPMPPILRVPAPTTDLAVVQRGDRLLVELGYPQTTAAGTPLGGVAAVTATQLVAPLPSTTAPGAEPEIDDARFTAGAAPVLVLEGEDLASAVQGDRIVFELPVPEAEAIEGDAAVSLAVVTRGPDPDGRESARSNRVTFPLVEPPAPPTEVEATGEANGVRIRWSHPLIEVVREQMRAAAAADAETEAEAEEAEEAKEAETAQAEAVTEEETPAEGEEAQTADEVPAFAGFNVYRRLATERTYGPPIRSVGPRADSLLDESALFDQRYIYAVSAVAARRPVTVESGFAEEVEVDYRDRFAPPTPTRLVALTEGRQVRLVWEASAAPDLAGYRIYRRGPDTQEFQAVNDAPTPGTDFTDRGLAPGATYTYQVTAVDRLGNESTPSATATAAIR